MATLSKLCKAEEAITFALKSVKDYGFELLS